MSIPDETLARWAELPRPGTPGPWVQGDIWCRAGVKSEMFGEGRCAYCATMGEPVWIGLGEINGERMPSHLHRDPDPWKPGHMISGADGLVAGNYDSEEGGIVNPDDVAAICALPEMREAIDALVARVRFLERYVTWTEARGKTFGDRPLEHAAGLARVGDPTGWGDA